MKKLILVFSIVTIIAMLSFKTIVVGKDYVTLSGKIMNPTSDSLVINADNFKKKITVKKDGTFSDTIKVKTDKYFMTDGKEYIALYLKNGYDLKMTLDAQKVYETIKFIGTGAVENNYLAKQIRLQRELFSDATILDNPESVFNKKVANIENKLLGLLKATKNLDPNLITLQKKEYAEMKGFMKMEYDNKKTVSTELAQGKVSPKFMSYENNSGGQTSLDDLKGKFVYIDLWATWCGPCKQELPFLKEVEKEYHDKNIHFVSISMDALKDHDKWKKMIADKQMTGVQLYSKEDKAFAEAYKVQGIPRFILIDPKGNIVNADAPRPSDKKLKELFTSLGI
jgi:thiol-disulfide isomerase/thioredoxin